MDMGITRRGLVLGAGAVGAAQAVAACGAGRPGSGAGAGGKEPVTIEWFNAGDTQDEGRSRVVAQFREKHPHVTPNVTLGGANNNEGYRAKLKTLIASD